MESMGPAAVLGAGVWGEFGVCSVPFGLVTALGRVAALNDGALGGIARLGRVDLSRGRLGRVRPDDLALGGVAALHDLRLAVAGLHYGALGRVAGLDVALLDLGLDDGRRVDDGGRVGQLRLSFFLVLLV